MNNSIVSKMAKRGREKTNPFSKICKKSLHSIYNYRVQTLHNMAKLRIISQTCKQGASSLQLKKESGDNTPRLKLGRESV
jgi:hypothetical protein